MWKFGAAIFSFIAPALSLLLPSQTPLPKQE
jgi:hypothetical protein